MNRLLQKRCSRWVEERKIKPLLTLAKASARLPQENVDIDFVNKCIVEIYGKMFGIRCWVTTIFV